MSKKISLLGLLAICFASMSFQSAEISLAEEGPKGCKVLPTDLKGKCAKNTEGTYTCFVAAPGETMDCTSSD